MVRKSETEALRQIRTLYALGPAGGLTDAQLVARFLSTEGADREDAFAALVQRHGPMVLRVCRRMLAGSPDAEDALQAVFLVLARKAGSLRRVEDLKSWLYGVAVRTAKEARRRSARRRTREGGPMDESRIASPQEEELGDVLALLDEEIDRLPIRFREALMLCELEGVSRQEAARRLGVPEGTLSSRLSRGRSLLRDRLARRGVALGAGGLAAVVPEAASAALSEPLAETTVRLALKFAAGGAAAGSVPAAVASLAEGVLAMIRVARLKLVLLTTATLGAAVCLTAGLAWAVGPREVEKPRAEEPAAVIARPQDEEKTSGPVRVRGVVVDDAGRPVEGAAVLVDPFQAQETRGTSGPDGSFDIPTRRHQLDGAAVLVRSPEGKRLGGFTYRFDLTPEVALEPLRIVLKPAREITVRVVDAAKGPVRGAAVEAVGRFAVLADATTGADGTARLFLPADAKVGWIFALKSGQGVDYNEYGKLDQYGRSQEAAAVSSLPDSVLLTLNGARTVRIKAVGHDGQPLAGVIFAPGLLHKEGRQSHLLPMGRITGVTTGPDGLAIFDWLPATRDDFFFGQRSEGYARRRVDVKSTETGTVVVRLVRTETIRGRVVHADGSPARGIEVHASGSTMDAGNGSGRILTAADGTYSMNLSPNDAYVVSIEDKDWAARSRLDVVVREGKPVNGVDFVLTRGTVLRGRVTIAPDDRPAAGQWMLLHESGGSAPADLLGEGGASSREVYRQFGPHTDATGHYSVRIGPGTYTLFSPDTEIQTITIGDEAEVVRDFQMPRPSKGPLSGRVVLATDPDTGVAGARIDVVSTNMYAGPFSVAADNQGRFRVERDLNPLVIGARSPDGRLGAIVELGPEDPEVVLALSPTATATGLLLDEQGKPAPNLELYWGRRVNYGKKENGPSSNHFAPKVVTDADGQFTLPSLVVGQEYNISVLRGNVYPATGMVRPESPAAIDLGKLRIGAYRPKPGTPESDEAMSSFRRDAPGAGQVAPPFRATTLDGKPLTLDGFRGQYVLLDFWATWCGPCLGEIPQLQAVHDAFASDGRFVILSLSVDDKIEEPRSFQEKRKLPWSQAFLGAGIHGTVPGTFGIEAIPAFVLVGPDGKIVARGMRGADIKKAVARALAKAP